MFPDWFITALDVWLILLLTVWFIMDRFNIYFRKGEDD